MVNTFFCQCNRSALILVVSIFSQDLKANEGVLTTVQGVGAIRELASNTNLQKEVKLTVSQIAELNGLKREFRRANPELDVIAKQQLNRILTLEQTSILRKAVLGRRFHNPLQVFDANFLEEVGFTEKEVVILKEALLSHGSDLSKSLDLLRISAMEIITNELPQESTALFWSWFGKGLEVQDADADWRGIFVLEEANVDKQLSVAGGMVLPNGLELSRQQRSDLDELDIERHMKEIKFEKLDRIVISQRLDSIFSKRQRYALVQRIQQQTLRSNLLVALRPEIVKRLNLPLKDVEELKARLLVIDRDIKRSELARRKDVFNKVISLVSAEKQAFLKSLFDGVWIEQR